MGVYQSGTEAVIILEQIHLENKRHVPTFSSSDAEEYAVEWQAQQLVRRQHRTGNFLVRPWEGNCICAERNTFRNPYAVTGPQRIQRYVKV